MSDTLWPHGLYSSWNSPGQNTGVGSLSLLQGISPTQGLNPDLPHCRWILYQLSHQGSPGTLQWVAYPFFSGSSDQELYWGLLHCWWILNQLSYQGSPLREHTRLIHLSVFDVKLMSPNKCILFSANKDLQMKHQLTLLAHILLERFQKWVVPTSS